MGISELKELARFESLQAYYSIAGRDLEREIVPLLESEKVGLLVWGCKGAGCEMTLLLFVGIGTRRSTGSYADG